MAVASPAGGNAFHRFGDWLDRFSARVKFAFGALSGRWPLPTIQQEANMAAIDDLNTAVSNVKNYVASLQGDLANADMTSQIEAATEALNGVLPAPAATVDTTSTEPAPAE